MATPFGTMSIAEMTGDAQIARALLDAKNPENRMGLGVAQVVTVNYEEHWAEIRMISGSATTWNRTPIPLTYPGAGARHILGTMPSAGDLCLVGWIYPESESKSKTPVILQWFIPGVHVGREWMTTSNWGADEIDMSVQKVADLADDARQPIRHKLRHYQGGNVFGSSSQGSDFVLDESVSLWNRRGAEFQLRDSDNAAVTRALENFGVFAGVRTSSGLIQRNALLIADSLVSDGRDWTNSLDESETALASSDILRNTLLTDSGDIPVDFLSENLLNADGTLAKPNQHKPDMMYGGQPYRRIPVDPNEPVGAMFTEHRIEVINDANSTLPVSDETEFFDADKALDERRPLVEFVLGTVVGNDAVTPNGRLVYGKPLTAIVSEGASSIPRIEAAMDSSEHLAALFRIHPDDATGLLDSWVAWTKQGQLRAVLGGPSTQNSAEIAMFGGLDLSVQGALNLNLNGAINLSSTGRGGASIASSQGPAGLKGRTVEVLSDTTMSQRAVESITTSAPIIDTSADKLTLNGTASVNVTTSGQYTRTADVASELTTGKKVETFTGPKNFMPTNGALHERTYTPVTPGLVCEETTYTWGDRKETFNLGNHSTTILVGNMTYETLLGKLTLTGTTSTVTMDATGINGTALTGSVALEASTGPATLKGLTGATVEAVAGVATLKGGVGVRLVAPVVGTEAGFIITSGSRDPLTGLPFATFGMGAPFHTVG